MNYPSNEFSEAVARLCVGTANEDEVAGLHALLRGNPAAQDEYLWEVELHARLAQGGGGAYKEGATEDAEAMQQRPTPNGPGRTGFQRPTPNQKDGAARFWESASVGRERTSKRENLPDGRRRWQWRAMVVGVVIGLGVGWWIFGYEQDRLPYTLGTNAPGEGAGFNGGGSPAGIYRTTVRFAIAADAPVIVGTGRAEPIALGAEVPHEQAGDTLHVWDWSKSPMSRVIKDTRLWPDEVFAVSPDGRTFVWANGKILDLASGEQSKIDLGGALHLDHLGGHMQRIVKVQFLRDGRRLALQLSNLALAKSVHPLRKQDFSTTETMQVVTFPEGKLVCEFPAGYRMAWSEDGSRAAGGFPPDKAGQEIVEYSAVSGEVRRKYEPRLREFTYANAYSPDGSRFAAFDSAGELLIWDAASGELKQRVAMKENSPGDLRFSPDGKLVAISFIQRTRVVEVGSGVVVATIPQEVPGIIRWTADSAMLEAISNVLVGSISEREEAGRRGVYNVMPTIKRWSMEEFRGK